METRQQSLPHGYALQGKKNRYVIDKVLGQGAFGITYLARYKASILGDIGAGSIWAQVAIKEFFMRDLNTRDDSTGSLNDTSQDGLISRYRRAFMREARNLAGLHHANIVNVFEVIEANNTVYIVMEYINGGTLDEHISQSGYLTEEESIDKMLKLCSAVGFMHEHRMLHLDIKPRNVMLDEEDDLYLIDFGLSRQFNADGEPESSTSIGLGTPGYAPGEQAVYQDGDKRFRATLDIYALGATMFKMLTGKTPPNATDVSDSVLDGDNIILKRLRESGVSESLAAVVSKAMFPSSGKRYQTVQEFETALKDITESTHYDGQTPVPDSNPAGPQSPYVSGPILSPVPEPRNKKRNGLPKWLYGVIAALLFVGVIAYFVLPKSKQDSTSTPQPDASGQIEVISPTNNSDPVKPVDEGVQTNVPSSIPEDSEPAPQTIELTSVSLDRTSLALDEGASYTLTVKYTPSDATDKSITWKSTDTKVATVSSSGRVTAVKDGSATIIASSGGKEAYCNVTVNTKPQPVQQPVNNSTNSSSVIPSSTSSSTGTTNGHEWVDLGLSVKWATCNVGASKPEGYGDYYAWGETSTKSSYTWSTYKYCNGSYKTMTKYCNDREYGYNGFMDNKTTLDLNDDVARVKWGGNWRMPTYSEFEELLDNCTWTWATLNGIWGYKVTSKKSGYTSRSIFLPAAGWRDGSSLSNAGKVGDYWSSSLDSGYQGHARYLYFYSVYHNTSYHYRYCGRSVRPVCP